MSICIICNDVKHEISTGDIFVRRHRESGLKCIRVDTVILIGETPERIKQLGKNLVGVSRNPQIIEL